MHKHVRASLKSLPNSPPQRTQKATIRTNSISTRAIYHLPSITHLSVCPAESTDEVKVHITQAHTLQPVQGHDSFPSSPTEVQVYDSHSRPTSTMSANMFTDAPPLHNVFGSTSSYAPYPPHQTFAGEDVQISFDTEMVDEDELRAMEGTQYGVSGEEGMEIDMEVDAEVVKELASEKVYVRGVDSMTTGDVQAWEGRWVSWEGGEDGGETDLGGAFNPYGMPAQLGGVEISPTWLDILFFFLFNKKHGYFIRLLMIRENGDRREGGEEEKNRRKEDEIRNSWWLAHILSSTFLLW